MGYQELAADSIHTFDIDPHDPISHVKLNIYPDGGVSRVRIFGRRFSAQSPTATADTQKLRTIWDVIQIDGSKQFEINSGYTTRVHDLIDIQLDGEDAGLN